jgi:hypothetical protein
VKKLKSYDIPLTDAELGKTEPKIQKVQALQTTVGKEISRLQLMAFFIRMRIQPLHYRAHQMWNYSGSADETHVSKDDVAEDEVKKMARRFTTLSTADEVPIACQGEYFNKDHPTPSVCFVGLSPLSFVILFSLLVTYFSCILQDHRFLFFSPSASSGWRCA